MSELERQITEVLGNLTLSCREIDVVLFGDSITQGLGSKKINFTQSLQDKLGEGYRILNLAYTGTTIDFPLALLDDQRFPAGGGVAVVLYGNVDAQIRPSRSGRLFQMLPSRFRKNGMLMPRPFYSRNVLKSVVQHGENVLRRLFNKTIRAIDGTEQWVSIEAFETKYRELIRRLFDCGFSPVCCSTVYIDEKLFEGSLEQYMAFNGVIKNVAVESSAPYVDLFNALQTRVEVDGWDASYNKDHFHPNGKGYLLMAGRIASAIRCLEEG